MPVTPAHDTRWWTMLTRCSILFALLIAAFPPLAIAQPAAPPQDTEVPPPLTHYMGREIAQTMHWLGAEWLIREGWTDRAHLGIFGGSNGGLLTGAALVERPELFRAVVSAVPLLDMLRYQHFLMARYWVPEYGSSEDRDQLGFLLRYSPYQHVVDGVHYPAVFLTAAENDARVHPLHARKMTARLQAATASDPAQRPVLLWVERDAGHGVGKPLDLRVRDAADLVGFFAWQLGLGAS